MNSMTGRFPRRRQINKRDAANLMLQSISKMSPCLSAAMGIPNEHDREKLQTCEWSKHEERWAN